MGFRYVQHPFAIDLVLALHGIANDRELAEEHCARASLTMEVDGYWKHDNV
jgi:hypothetical protein